MDLTKKYLKDLQRQLVSQQEGAPPTLSSSRIDLLLLHQEELPLGNTSDEIDSESVISRDGDATDALNTSIENFKDVDANEDGHLDLTSRSCLTINESQLRDAQVKFHDQNGLSKIFDPNNTSLLYVEKDGSESDINRDIERDALKPIDVNTTSPFKAIKQNTSKLPLAESLKPLKVTKGRMLNAPGLHNGASVAHQTKPKPKLSKGSKLPLTKSIKPKLKTSSDLSFPIMDRLVSMRTKERSL